MYTIRELRDEINRRCRKQDSAEYHAEEEEEGERDVEEAFVESTESAVIAEESLPFEDVLAEKRRKYTAKQEFTLLLYNDILENFVQIWKGNILRKKWHLKTQDEKVDTEVSTIEEEDHPTDSDKKDADIEDTEKIDKKDVDVEETGEAEEEEQEEELATWKLQLKDEHADISFVNQNSYVGRVSRKAMEGKGLYGWNNGARYKGDFEANEIQGKGLLEWSDSRWYEGELYNGIRHGKGTMVDRDHGLLYVGQWFMGRKHGKGYCRYGDGDSYEGDWVMGKREGVGLRTYRSGARYIGQWRNDLRHGIGTMAWSNGDVYRGEWENGRMHGYGEYTWKGFFNRTFSWPGECCYIGEWHNSIRHGKGVLKLHSIGGAKYSGNWKNNKKDGYGIIIGNNGEVTERDPLFVNDILVGSITPKNSSLEIEGEGSTKQESVEKQENIENQECVKKDEHLTIHTRIQNLDEIPRPLETTVSKPEQFPILNYHLRRLLTSTFGEGSSTEYVVSGRCYWCDDISCSCLLNKEPENIKTNGTTSSETVQTSSVSMSSSAFHKKIEMLWQLEEHWTYCCIARNMTRLRQIYDIYARLYTKEPPKCDLIMSRIMLWQFWRDCGVHKKKLGLVDIDDHIKANASTFVEDFSSPFEKVEIWQFLHALLEVSWHLYTKHNDFDMSKVRGKLAGGLQKFLDVDVYPNAGNHVGNLVHDYDLLPLFSMYQLYRKLGSPLTTKRLLRAIFIMKDDVDPLCLSCVPAYLLEGVNCVTVGERVSYLSREDGPRIQPKTEEIVEKKIYGLSVFREMDVVAFVTIIIEICPSMKDPIDNVISNMEYKLTFLEFYEILLEATRRILIGRKIKQREHERIKEQEVESSGTSLTQEQSARSRYPKKRPRKST